MPGFDPVRADGRLRVVPPGREDGSEARGAQFPPGMPPLNINHDLQ